MKFLTKKKTERERLIPKWDEFVHFPAINVSYPELAKQIEMSGLSGKDLLILKSLQPIIEENIETIMTSFYAAIVREEKLLQIINQNSSVDKLKGTLRTHITQHV
ncbi:protoglobin domain-containing protein [Metabacillus sp. RGM 3146]|uniref:protoglobin domain-containing protein n=1 Tax=Metabacillus sp. RGM 3146 TaxID=3401092 RepID=UPI003B9D36CA